MTTSEVFYIDRTGYTTTQTTQYDGDGTITTTASGSVIIEPSEGGITQIGSNFESAEGLDDVDDLGVDGKIECHNTAYFGASVFVDGVFWTSSFGAIMPGLVAFSSQTRHNDDTPAYFGTYSKCSITYSTDQTNEAFVISSPSTSNQIIIAKHGDDDTDFVFGNQYNPTVYIMSSGTTAAKHLALSHRGGYGDVSCGIGSTCLSASTNSPEPADNNRFWVTEDSGSAVLYLKCSDGTVISGAWTAL